MVDHSSDERALAEKRLIDDIESRDGHLSTGFVGTKDLMPTLTKIGRSDVAYRLFHNDTFPSWGFTIRHGATSIWERWNGWTPERGFENPGMNSFAHYAFGAVGEWMFRTIGGIETDGPAFKEIVIRPLPGGTLSWADTRHESIRGTVATRWEIDETSEGEPECLRLDVTIPANATATIYVPADNVSHVQEGSLSAAEAEGLEYLRTDSGGAVFRAESGSYRFIVRPAPIGL